MLSKSVYGRAWHTARQAALGPDLAATALARRPYDLRHAALSLWLNASGEPAEVAARAGNSTRVLHEVYLHCIDGKDRITSQRIEDALDADLGSPAAVTVRESKRLCTPSATTPDPVRYVSVNRSLVPRIAHARQDQQARVTTRGHQRSSEFPQLRQHLN